MGRRETTSTRAQQIGQAKKRPGVRMVNSTWQLVCWVRDRPPLRRGGRPANGVHPTTLVRTRRVKIVHVRINMPHMQDAASCESLGIVHLHDLTEK